MNVDEFSVKVSDLTVKFGNFTAVDHISFSVRKGEIFGFLGANGAGKTTTIRVLCGLLLPTEGIVRVAGFDFKDGSENIKSKVGYMSQRFTLYHDLTVKENLDFAASLRKLNDEEFKRRIKELFEFVGFNTSTDTLVGDLPAGIRQEVSLVAAMIHDPEIVFLDEPTAGVSPIIRERFWTLIRRLTESRKTVFVTTHYMDEAEQCDRIALMGSGKIIAVDTPSGFKKNFPELLIEIEPKEDAPQNWIEQLKKEEGVIKIVTYGMRYHLTIKNKECWEKLSKRMKSGLDAKPIHPSLEDVFIRLVEPRI